MDSHKEDEGTGVAWRHHHARPDLIPKPARKKPRGKGEVAPWQGSSYRSKSERPLQCFAPCGKLPATEP